MEWELITQKIPRNNEKNNLDNENVKGLYWRDPTVNSCLKEKPLRSSRTFSTVPYLTLEPATFAPSKTALIPFLSPFHLFLCFVPIKFRAKLKWFVCLLYLLDEFWVYGLDLVNVTT